MLEILTLAPPPALHQDLMAPSPPPRRSTDPCTEARVPHSPALPCLHTPAPGLGGQTPRSLLACSPTLPLILSVLESYQRRLLHSHLLRLQAPRVSSCPLLQPTLTLPALPPFPSNLLLMAECASPVRKPSRYPSTLPTKSLQDDSGTFRYTREWESSRRLVISSKKDLGVNSKRLPVAKDRTT